MIMLLASKYKKNKLTMVTEAEDEEQNRPSATISDVGGWGVVIVKASQSRYATTSSARLTTRRLNVNQLAYHGYLSSAFAAYSHKWLARQRISVSS
jgi:hypothetical protein